MIELLEFVVRHGYSLIFAWVFIEQAGLPIPSAPLLLAAGALSGTGRMNLGLAIGIAAFAAIASDSMWYELGRLKVSGYCSFCAAFHWSRILAFGERR